MIDCQCVEFLQWSLPRLQMRWPGFRKVRKQVCKRIDRRIKQLGLSDVAAYRGYLEASPAEWSVLDSFCRISISRFYRDRSVFDCLGGDVLPGLASLARERGDHTVRCWSAGCASGEEVYTLAIIWKLRVEPHHPGVSLHVVATDSDREMLDRAQEGCYSISSLKDFPKEWLPIAFEQQDDAYCVRPGFRDPIEFVLQDIRYETPAGLFDVVLCRHLAFTYFDEALQRQTIQQILAKLSPGGIFVAGKQEPLPAGCLELEEYRPRMGIYRKRCCG